MGEKAITDALMIARELQIIVARLETGLLMANALEGRRIAAEHEQEQTGQPVANIDQLDPQAIREHVADYLHEFVTPAWAKIDRLHRLQRRCFRLEDS